VLAVFWSPEEFPANQVRDAAIREVLSRSPLTIDYFAEYLESDHFPEDQAASALREYMRLKYARRHIDVVLAVTDVALRFVLQQRDELFPDAPVVYLGALPPDPAVRRAAPGLTGVVTGAGFLETLDLALTMHPKTKRVFVVARWPAIRLDSVKAELQGVGSRVDLTYLAEESLAGLLDAIAHVPADSVVLYIRYAQDVLDAASSIDVARLIAERSPVPVYAVAEGFIGSGVVGGRVYATREAGKRLAELALHVLNGQRPDEIPIEQASLAPTFDWRQLRRWGISERALPAGSVVLFREVSVWERYRTIIVGTAGLLLLQSLLIAGLVFERRRRRRAEMNERRNLVAMAHLDRRAAMGELATTLAHELNQPLNAILQNAGVAQILLTSQPVPPALAEIPDIISDIRKDDIRASEVIRRMRGLLQKHELESKPVNLNEVAQDTVAIVRLDAKSRGVDLDIELTEGVRPITGDRVHLQQVVLNLLMNALDAVVTMPPERRQVRLSTALINGEVRLAVADTGVGIEGNRIAEMFEPFYTTKKEGSGMGMGLAIARGIVEAHSGRMAAENNSGGGATVWFSVPMPAGTQPCVQQNRAGQAEVLKSN
jgi:signal transduction histidine kinase